MELTFHLDKLHWSSDWNGDEVGWPELDVVGLYTYQPNVGPSIHFYIDMDSGLILDMWSGCDCDE